MPQLPLVAIIGRPNVGKSALFNRIVQEGASIVDDRPGVTRDRIYRTVTWSGRAFRLVDTGGWSEEADDVFLPKVRQQVLATMAEAAVVILVVDARTGLTADDFAVADLVRRARCPVVVAANKADHAGVDVGEAFRLGFGEPEAVSAAHGHGVYELLDRVVALLPMDSGSSTPDEGREPIRLALVGRPNAGKSTLLNRLVGEERSLVTEVPGTTVDPVDVTVEHQGRRFLLVDTAGLRRRTRVTDRLEQRAAQRAMAAIKRADVAVLVVDATVDLTDQDKRIASYAHEHGRPVVIAYNKWDAVPEVARQAGERRAHLREEMPWLAYAPVVFVSGLTGRHVHDLLQHAARAYEATTRRLPTHELNEWLKETLIIAPPPPDGRRRLKIYYVTEPSVQPPEFLFFVNDTSLLVPSYERYLEHQLRERFDIGPTPIRLRFRQRT